MPERTCTYCQQPLRWISILGAWQGLDGTLCPGSRLGHMPAVPEKGGE